MRKHFKSAAERGALSLTAEEVAFGARAEETHEALWARFFPAVQRVLACSLTAAAVPEVAEFAAAMVRLAMDKPSSDGERSFDKLFAFFAHSPSIRPSLSCHFLLHVLQGDVEASRKLYLTQGSNEGVIKGWLRCSALLSGKQDDAAALNDLTTEVMKLTEFTDLSLYMPMDGDSSNKNLWRQILRCVWNKRCLVCQ